MKVSSYLNRDHVLLDVRSPSKQEVLRELLVPLIQSGALSGEQGEEVGEKLIERERQMSTGIDLGVAVPHCRVGFVEEPLLVLGLCRNGLDFDSFDGSPTNILVLVLVPEDRPKVHIQILSAVARLLTRAQDRHALLEAESEDEVLARMARLENPDGD